MIRANRFARIALRIARATKVKTNWVSSEAARRNSQWIVSFFCCVLCVRIWQWCVATLAKHKNRAFDWGLKRENVSPNRHSNTVHEQCHLMFCGRGVNDREFWHVECLLAWCQYLLVRENLARTTLWQVCMEKPRNLWVGALSGVFPMSRNFFEIRPQNVHTDCVKS